MLIGFMLTKKNVYCYSLIIVHTFIKKRSCLYSRHEILPAGKLPPSSSVPQKIASRKIAPRKTDFPLPGINGLGNFFSHASASTIPITYKKKCLVFSTTLISMTFRWCNLGKTKTWNALLKSSYLLKSDLLKSESYNIVIALNLNTRSDNICCEKKPLAD